MGDRLDAHTIPNVSIQAPVDPEIKTSNLRRHPHAGNSAHEALRAVARALMRSHLAHCAGFAIQTGTKDEKEAMYDELLELIYKNAR